MVSSPRVRESWAEGQAEEDPLVRTPSAGLAYAASSLHTWLQRLLMLQAGTPFPPMHTGHHAFLSTLCLAGPYSAALGWCWELCEGKILGSCLGGQHRA